MARCDTCGNDYDKAFKVQMNGQSYTFDSFECATHKLAPTCAHCGCRMLGKGVEDEGVLYCCARCARAHGEAQVHDRGDQPQADLQAPAP